MKQYYLILITIIFSVSSSFGLSKAALADSLNRVINGKESYIKSLIKDNGTKDNKVDSLTKQNKDLKKQNEDLLWELNKSKSSLIIADIKIDAMKMTIDSLTNYPLYLYNIAQEMLSEDDLVSADSILKILIEQYPNSEEAIRAKNSKSNIAKEVKNIVDSTNMENLELSHDEFNSLTFYRDKRTCYNSWSAFKETTLNLYFSIEDGKKIPSGLRLKIRYNSSDWLFVRKAHFLINKKKYVVSGSFDRDNYNGAIVEWVDNPVSKTNIGLIKALISCDTAKVRLEGSQYYSDMDISEENLAAIRSIYELYIQKGGKI